MILAPECRDCLKDKIRSQASYVVHDETRLDEIVAACLETFDEGMSRNEGAAVASGRMHRLCYQMAGSSDLYADIKERDNIRAIAVVDAVAPMLFTLHDALVASVIGNAMDYGVTGHNVADDFTKFFKDGFMHGLAIDDSEKFFPLAKRVVYFTDNCGEIIFDMQFIRKLKEMGSFVTVVVKEEPMLNDVTVKEAE
ncbi:MAG TPA: ARMT1-like domain-containing protein, partial [Methanocorpusculum sp.]|nr:ARMT1-like domain-containing protein [Methanocorpusculum sp.]